MAGLDVPVLMLLVVVSLVGGVGITAFGPGGVLVTIGLFAVTDLTAASVAGTAIVTHIATGVLASLAYRHSGHLREPRTRRAAAVLCAAAVVGTPLGVWANTQVSRRAFAVALAVFLVVVAALIWLRERGVRHTSQPRWPDAPALAAVGFGVAAASGLFGVGGPLLAVPVLVAAGTPPLSALAAAQVQSIVIATVGSAGYLLHGSISWPLAVLVGVPELCGVIVGWKIARALPTRALTFGLVAVLLALAPYLALRG